MVSPFVNFARYPADPAPTMPSPDPAQLPVPTVHITSDVPPAMLGKVNVALPVPVGAVPCMIDEYELPALVSFKDPVLPEVPTVRERAPLTYSERVKMEVLEIVWRLYDTPDTAPVLETTKTSVPEPCNCKRLPPPVLLINIELPDPLSLWAVPGCSCTAVPGPAAQLAPVVQIV